MKEQGGTTAPASAAYFLHIVMSVCRYGRQRGHTGVDGLDVCEGFDDCAQHIGAFNSEPNMNIRSATLPKHHSPRSSFPGTHP